MAIDVNIFVSNKRDVIQKTLAILEIASTNEEIKSLVKKNNISEDLVNDCKDLINKFEKGLISLFDYDKLNTEELEEFWKYVLLRELSGLILDNKVPLLKSLKKLNFKNHDKNIDSLLELKEKELENIGKLMVN